MHNLILFTILSNSKEHGGVTGECHKPSNRILSTFSRSGGGISTRNPSTFKIRKVCFDQKVYNYLPAKD